MCNKNLRKIKEVNNQGLYALLNVAVDAPESVIKKAYKKKALQNHPDKGGDDISFHRIQEACSILTGPLRGLYDACGEEGLELKQQAEPQVKHSMLRERICVVLSNVIVGELFRLPSYLRRSRL